MSLLLSTGFIFSDGKTGLSGTTLHNRNNNQEKFKSPAVSYQPRLLLQLPAELKVEHLRM